MKKQTKRDQVLVARAKSLLGLDRCCHVWADYTPFGDVDHRCDKIEYADRLCREHWEEVQEQKRKEEQWAVQAKAIAREEKKRDDLVYLAKFFKNIPQMTEVNVEHTSNGNWVVTFYNNCGEAEEGIGKTLISAIKTFEEKIK